MYRKTRKQNIEKEKNVHKFFRTFLCYFKNAENTNKIARHLSNEQKV